MNRFVTCFAAVARHASLCLMLTAMAGTSPLANAAEVGAEQAAVMLIDVELGDLGQELYIVNTQIKQAGGLPEKRGHRMEPASESKGMYRVELVDAFGEVIFQTHFAFPTLMTVPMPEPGDGGAGMGVGVVAAKPKTTVVVPYFDNASLIRVRPPGDDVPSVLKSIAHVDHKALSQGGAGAKSNAPNGLDILVLASGYDGQSLSRFYAAAEGVRNELLSVEPFKTFAEGVNVGTYGNLADLGCQCGCEGIDKLMCCDTDKVVAAALESGQYHDEVIVVHNTKTYCGGGYIDGGLFKDNSVSSYAMAYDGEWTAAMAVHEFGHSFGNLCDEYEYETEFGGATEGYASLGCVNCRSSCSGWSSLTGACQAGCSIASAFRRADDSIMRDLLISSFNDVSIKHSLMPRLFYFMSEGSGSPYVDMRINDSDAVAFLQRGDNILIDVAIAGNAHVGALVDWWVYADTPKGLYYYDVSGGQRVWRRGLSVTHQGPLFNFNPFAMVNTAGLPAGTYTVYFEIDSNMNGVKEDPSYYDAIPVDMQ